MIPIEVMTLTGSALGSFVLKLWAQARADKAEQRRMELQALTNLREERSAIREISGRFAITRQIVVLSSVAMLLVVPGLSWLWPETVLIHVPFQDSNTTEVLWGIFTYQTKVSGYQTMTGIVYQPWMVQLMTSITGLYLGSSIAEVRR